MAACPFAKVKNQKKITLIMMNIELSSGEKILGLYCHRTSRMHRGLLESEALIAGVCDSLVSFFRAVRSTFRSLPGSAKSFCREFLFSRKNSKIYSLKLSFITYENYDSTNSKLPRGEFKSLLFFWY